MSMLAVRSRLPVELLDLITDHLASSFWPLHDLEALSLANSVFLQRARHHLFHKILAHGRQERTFPKLLTFLASAPLLLRVAIREAVIDGSICYSQFPHGPVVGGPTVGKKALRRLLGYLPQLESLTLTNIALADVLRPMSASGWGTPSGSSHYDTTYDTENEDGAILAGIGSRSLSRLELNETCSVNASPADYLAMLAPFCAIGTLRIKDCYWANEDDLPSKAEGRDIPETGAASTRSLSVRRLELDVGKRTLIWLDLISRTRTVLGGDIAGGGANSDAYGNAEAGPTLREIAVTCNSVREVQFFGGFLGIAGQTVQEVEIDLGRLYEDDTDEEPENETVLAQALALPTSCPNLRGLTFYFSTRPFEQADSPEGRDLRDTLLQLLSYPSSQPPFRLDHVTLRVYCYPEYSMTAALDNITPLLNRIAQRLLPVSSSKSAPDPPIRKAIVIFEVPPQFGSVDGGLVQSLQFWMDVNMRKEEADGGMGQCVRDGRVELRWINVPEQPPPYC